MPERRNSRSKLRNGIISQQFYSIFELIQISLRNPERILYSEIGTEEVIGMQQRIPGRRNSIESTKYGNLNSA